MKRNLLLISLLVFLVQFSIGQDKSSSTKSKKKRKKVEKKGIIYEKEFSIGGKFHTQGWGVFGEYGIYKSAKRSTIYQVEITEFRHFKQTKQSYETGQIGAGNSPKPFVYGKQNNFYALKIGMGKRLWFTEKAERNGISVGFSYLYGISLGIQKPYYLELLRSLPNSGRFFISEEKYDKEDPDNTFLNTNAIYGSAGFGKGLGEIVPVPGGHGKAAIHFDWSSRAAFVRGVEAGVMLDLYYKKIPIMINQSNSFYFATLFVSVQFGKKW